MNRLSEFFKNLSATKQFLLVRTFYDWAIYVFDTFYMTYVFKESGEVKQVVINLLVTLLTVLVGYVLGSVFAKKVGIECDFRLSFILYVVTGLLGIYLVNMGAVSFLLISVFRGIAEGFYWASANVVELSGLPHDSRSRFYSMSHAINGAFNVVVPVSLGYLLTKSDSLLPAFIIFTAICVVATLIPLRFNINDRLTIHKKNFLTLTKHTAIKPFC